MTKHIAIVLAGGNGSRMKSDIPKQYMLIAGKPVIYYSLMCFEESFIDEIILVCKEGEQEYCRKEIVEKYNFRKIHNITVGGKERFDSVFNGLKIINSVTKTTEEVYVYIHDGARPCIDRDILDECRKNVISEKACVPSVPVKDTIKVMDSQGYVEKTPDRNSLMIVQTPQCFEKNIVYNAFLEMYKRIANNEPVLGITDDAMVVERFGNIKVKLCHGSYNNLKITTPDDLPMAEKWLKIRG